MLKTVCQNTLPFHSHRDITARFDGGSLTSDAGIAGFKLRGLSVLRKAGTTLRSS